MKTVGCLYCPYLITLDFLSLYDFTNRLSILRFNIVRIGLGKVICNNLLNSSQPTDSPNLPTQCPFYHTYYPWFSSTHNPSFLPSFLCSNSCGTSVFQSKSLGPVILQNSLTTLPTRVETQNIFYESDRHYMIPSDSVMSVRFSLFPKLSKTPSSLPK